MKYFLIAFLVFFSSCSVVKKIKNRKVTDSNSEESSIAYNFAFTEATKQKLFGNYSQALTLLFKCAEVNPSSSATYYLISEIYLKNGQTEKALDYCRLAVKFNPKNNWYRIDLATLYKMSGKTDSSIVQYKYLVKKNPNNFRYQYNLAALYFEYGEFWKSLKIIKHLVDNDKKNEELVITKFQIERKLKRYRSAENTLKKIYKRLPEDYKYLGLLAEHYKSIGKIKKGENAYKELLKKDSVNEIGIIGLATFYIESNRITEVEHIIKTKLLNDKDLSEVEIQFLLNSLKVKEISSEYKIQMVNIIKNWFVNNSDYEIELKDVAEVFISAGYVKDGSDLFEYLFHNQVEFKVLDTYLMLLNLQDRNKEILKITADSLSKGESSEYLFYYNGVSYYKMKMYKEASETFQKGLSFIGEDRLYEEQMLTLLGESYYKLNETDKTFENFDKVLNINPYNLYVLNNYSYYLSLLNESLGKAEEMSKKCIMMDKLNFNYLDTYGWVLYKRGKFMEAYKVLKNALEVGGKSDKNVISHYNEVIKTMNLKN